MEPVEFNKPIEKYTVNTNSWYMKLFIFIRTNRKSDLPEDTCALRREMFWSYLIFIISLPMFLIMKLIQKIVDEDEDMPQWLGLIITLLGFTLFMVIGSHNNSNVWTKADAIVLLMKWGVTNHVTILLIGWFSGGVILTTVMSIGFALGYYIVSYIYKIFKYVKSLFPKKNTNVKPTNTILKLYSDYRKKMCTPIKYK